MSGLDELEYWRLLAAVEQIQSLLVVGSPRDSMVTGMLVQFMEGARKRIQALELDGQLFGDHKRSAKEDAALAILVARESALSAAERDQYAALLKSEFFTKRDFDRLESFYSRSWDKLTDEGKDEMSCRVWEGVRRGEYKFNDLPDEMKEKEASQVQLRLERSKRSGKDSDAIPAVDKLDFLRARENGERQESYLILNRPGFAEHVSTRPGTEKEAAMESPRVLKAEPKGFGQPALEQVAVHMDSKNLNLQDFQGIDEVGAKLRPPLSEKTNTAGGKGRGQ